VGELGFGSAFSDSLGCEFGLGHFTVSRTHPSSLTRGSARNSGVSADRGASPSAEFVREVQGRPMMAGSGKLTTLSPDSCYAARRWNFSGPPSRSLTVAPPVAILGNQNRESLAFANALT
jgi:hypothetical protein